jgi:hypothetical protein
MENNKMLDYHEFYEELVEKEYIPDRIDYQWTDSNKDFMRDVLFAFYMTYSKVKDPDLLNAFLRLYSDIIVSAHSHFPEEEGYL